MKRTLVLASLSLLLLAGCATMAPKHVRPASPVPGAWPSGEAYGQAEARDGAPSAADLPWGDFFLNGTLREVISLALSNNRDLRAAALAVERSRALYGIRRADLFPGVDATGGGSVARIPETLTDTGQAVTSRQYDVGLAVAGYELDLFGRVRSLKDRALSEYLATEQARRTRAGRPRFRSGGAVVRARRGPGAPRPRPGDPRRAGEVVRVDEAPFRGRRLLRARPSPGPDERGRGAGRYRPVHGAGGAGPERPRSARGRPRPRRAPPRGARRGHGDDGALRGTPVRGAPAPSGHPRGGRSADEARTRTSARPGPHSSPASPSPRRSASGAGSSTTSSAGRPARGASPPGSPSRSSTAARTGRT